MNREQILALFTVDETGVVQSEGAFQGQRFYVPYFWFLYLSGYHERVDGEIVTFEVRSEDRAQFPELERQSVIHLVQTVDGRVSEVFDDRSSDRHNVAANGK